MTKVFHLGSERAKLSLIGECFNVFNISNLGGYSYNLTPASTSAAAAAATAGFGIPTSRDSNIFGSGGPRAFQFAARFSF